MAVALTFMLLPMFENLTGKMVSSAFLISQQLWAYILVGTLMIGLLAGAYPALVLSGFKPVLVLKGQFKSGKSGVVVRSILVVFQFTMSVILIVGTGVVYNQLEYVQNKNVGFDKEGVLILKNTFTLGNQSLAFKEELLKNTAIENITLTGYLPTNTWRSDSPLQPKESPNSDGAVGCQIWSVDHDYVETMRMKIIAGRDFSEQLVSDSSSVLLNETAAKRFGFKNPIGRKLKSLGDFLVFGKKEVTVIGVVEDFHFDSMHDDIGPMVITLDVNNDVIAIRYSSNDVKSVVEDIETTWNKFNPNHPLDYDFMDRQFNQKNSPMLCIGCCG